MSDLLPTGERSTAASVNPMISAAVKPASSLGCPTQLSVRGCWWTALGWSSEFEHFSLVRYSRISEFR